MLAPTSEIDERRLLQGAFYLDQVVMDDPLFPHTARPSDISNTICSYLGVPNSGKINRRSIASSALRMKQMRTLVAGNYLKFYPRSYQSEPPEHLPVNLSPDGYASALPRGLLRKYWERVNVRSMRQSDGALMVEDALSIGRGICIGFQGDESLLHQLYQYWEQTVHKIDDENQIIHCSMTLPEEPPGVEEWHRWVKQSVNQSALHHFQEIMEELTLANDLGATFLTRSQFVRELFELPVETPAIDAHIANCVWNLDVPFLEHVDAETLMSIRNSDGEAFQLFRRDLERLLRDTRIVGDFDCTTEKSGRRGA